jgi:hypothetical protein
MAITALIISGDEYFSPRPCAQIDYVLGQNQTRASFPECNAFYSGETPKKRVLVPANMNTSAMTAGATLGLSFGTALWLALAIHAIGIEVYIRTFFSPCSKKRCNAPI